MKSLAEFVRNWTMRHPAGRPVPMGDAFDLASLLEGAAANVYHNFARRFADRPEVAARWTAMAHDEEQHCSALMLARQALERDATFDLPCDRALLTSLAVRIDEAIADVDEKDFTARRALAYAWAIEGSEIDYLLDILTALPEHPLLHERIWEMKMSTGFHREKLKAISDTMIGARPTVSEWGE